MKTAQRDFLYDHCCGLRLNCETFMPMPLPTERHKLGNYLGQSNLEQMLLGLETTLGAATTTLLVDQVGEQMGRATVQDWQLGERATPLSSEELALLLEAALGSEGHALCRVRHIHLEDQKCLVTARLHHYELMRVFTGSAMRGILSELTGKGLAPAHIQADSLLLSRLTFTVTQESC